MRTGGKWDDPEDRLLAAAFRCLFSKYHHSGSLYRRRQITRTSIMLLSDDSLTGTRVLDVLRPKYARNFSKLSPMHYGFAALFLLPQLRHSLIRSLAAAALSRGPVVCPALLQLDPDIYKRPGRLEI